MPGFETKTADMSAHLAALVIANAFIFQEQRSQAASAMPSVSSLVDGTCFLPNTIATWSGFVSADQYKPVFAVALDLLSEFPSTTEVVEALRKLARLSITIAADVGAARHDVMGRIQHSLLHDSKLSRTHYTTNASAALLTHLALATKKWPRTDWADLKCLRSFKVGDLACGTGALLVAAADVLQDNFISTRLEAGGSVENADISTMQATIVEDIIYGYDVLPAATHSTAACLAMFAGKANLRTINIHTLPNGISENGQVLLGSIEFLMTGLPRTGRSVVQFESQTSASLPQLDLCIMNPPYMRGADSMFLSAGLDTSRGRMQKELSRRLRAANFSTFAAAGPGAAFVAVAHQHTKPDGRLALVLPASATTGVSWQRTRDLLKLEYHVETIVASHDPTRWNFSENSDFNEILLIARRRRPDELVEPDEQTRFISLWANPQNSVQAIAVVDKILTIEDGLSRKSAVLRGDMDEIYVGRQKVGETIQLDWLEVQGTSWTGAAFAQMELLRTAWSLSHGLLYLQDFQMTQKLPTTQLGNLCFVGPDGREVRDVLEGENCGPSDMRISDAAPCDLSSMSFRFSSGADRASSAIMSVACGKIDFLTRRTSHLMIVERSWMNTQRTLCVRAFEAGLATNLCALRFRNQDERMEKGLAVWLSSSLGLLALIAQRVPSKSAWVHLKKQSLRRTYVLNLAALNEDELDQLADLFDEESSTEFKPFSEIDQDAGRARVDNKISRILGLPSFDSIRRLLAKEPIISLQPCDSNPIDRVTATQKPSETRQYDDISLQ